MKKYLLIALFVLMVTPIVLPSQTGGVPSKDLRKVVTVVLGR